MNGLYIHVIKILIARSGRWHSSNEKSNPGHRLRDDRDPYINI